MRPFSVLFLGCFVGSVLSAGGSGMLNDMDMMKKWSKYKAQFMYTQKVRHQILFKGENISDQCFLASKKQTKKIVLLFALTSEMVRIKEINTSVSLYLLELVCNNVHFRGQGRNQDNSFVCFLKGLNSRKNNF